MFWSIAISWFGIIGCTQSMLTYWEKDTFNNFLSMSVQWDIFSLKTTHCARFNPCFSLLSFTIYFLY
ncbi:hypothetical protein GLYMA_15G108650v4 [Glycine max]|nr:hypothetical protein GLYMA_15G108650v4 [Glycine max]KAH1146607.1 hypothetical protein GYH30_041990 [Glycine max]